MIFNIGYPVVFLVHTLLNLPVHGMITKEMDYQDYIVMLKKVGQGAFFFDPKIKPIVNKLKTKKIEAMREATFTALLTPSELDWMAYLCLPRYTSSNGLHITLFLTEAERKRLTQSLFTKLQVNSKKELKSIFYSTIQGTVIEKLYVYDINSR